MKDEKGLTYIATIILVIIIIAFAIGVILYIQQQYRNEESETIKTNMLAIQGKAKMVAEEEKALKKELIGTKILIEQQDQKVKDFLKSQNIEIEENSKYYILKKEDNSSVISNLGKYAKLEYEVLKEKSNLSLVNILLHTGRHHQIRVQFASRNHPLYGDQRYGKSSKKQLALFAYYLSFNHPVTKEKLEFIKYPDKVGIWKEFIC